MFLHLHTFIYLLQFLIDPLFTKVQIPSKSDKSLVIINVFRYNSFYVPKYEHRIYTLQMGTREDIWFAAWKSSSVVIYHGSKVQRKFGENDRRGGTVDDEWIVFLSPSYLPACLPLSGLPSARLGCPPPPPPGRAAADTPEGRSSFPSLLSYEENPITHYCAG